MTGERVKLEGEIEDILKEFYDFVLVDLRRARLTAVDYRWRVRRFLKFAGLEFSREDIRAFLRTLLDKAPRTYANYLKALRCFIRDYLGRPDLIVGFKQPHVPIEIPGVIPDKKQLKKAFEALPDVRAKAIFLFIASTGLRKCEVLRLKREDVDWDLRCVKARFESRTKKMGIAFFNEEAEEWLKKYLTTRKDDKPKLFRIGTENFKAIWKIASKAAGVKITPHVLRKWHATTLIEAGVPGEIVDIFQGRAPRSILARHYLRPKLKELKAIYDRAGLRILS